MNCSHSLFMRRLPALARTRFASSRSLATSSSSSSSSLTSSFFKRTPVVSTCTTTATPASSFLLRAVFSRSMTTYSTLESHKRIVGVTDNQNEFPERFSPPEEEYPVYTEREVEKHNHKDDCWVVFNGRVFDVTEWLESHPGGAEMILEGAGKDITESFESIEHSEVAHDMLEHFYIGRVQERFAPSQFGLDDDRDVVA
eukprot:TRINITY_DN14652_c0_g1_i1.p1 TRINITY_DN14652_c0_g1~~TRINITY_DN14652_c0_g1_i1.p1  ORF type:complete len:221 (+),score=64.71 TRINITY_DN14652_c0_g1_i1:68-664(+)